MKKHARLFIPLLALAVLLAVAGGTHNARALSGSDDGTASSNSSSGSGSGSDGTDDGQEGSSDRIKQLAEQRKEAAEKRAAELKEAQEKRQAALKQKSESEQEKDRQKQEKFRKACENRTGTFKTRLGNIDTRTQKQLDTMDKIVERVKTFKTNKNLTVDNYDALLADVAAKRQVVVDLHDVLKQQTTSFTCGDDQSQAQANVQTFKDALKQEIDAIKAYRTAIKNLIVAVKTAAQAQEGATDNESHN